MEPCEARAMMTVSPEPVSLAHVNDLQGRTSAQLAWRDSGPEEGGYRIERRVAKRGQRFELVTIIPRNVTTYLDASLPGTNVYGYRIVPIRNGFPLAAAESAAIDTRGPLSALKLNLSAPGPREMRLSWTAPSADETGFRIERRESLTAAWQSIATLPATADRFVGYTDYTVRPNNSFQYRVITLRGDRSNGSNVADLKTPRGDITSLPAVGVSSFQAYTEAGTPGVYMDWVDRTKAETGYTIQRRWRGESTWTDIARLGINANQFFDATATDPTNLEYRIVTEGVLTRSFTETLRYVAPPIDPG
jgi:hypothetical protein